MLPSVADRIEIHKCTGRLLDDALDLLRLGLDVEFVGARHLELALLLKASETGVEVLDRILNLPRSPHALVVFSRDVELLRILEQRIQILLVLRPIDLVDGHFLVEL